jgi:CPA1 family monovalent cation:H+ antiporter
MHAQGLILLSGILLAGMGCQWIAWRMKLPAILFLLICGILAGPVWGPALSVHLPVRCRDSL